MRRVVVLWVLLIFVLTACGEAAAPFGATSVPATPSSTPTLLPDGTRVLIAPAPFNPPAVDDEQRLVMTGSTSGPVTLDPALLRDAGAAFLARQVFRGLVRLDNDLQVQPDLAERVEISANGLEYTFTLRAGATFQDGTPLNAAAVAASLDRACDPELAGGDGFALPAAIYLIDILGARERLAGQADEIAGIQIVDDVTLRITLERPVASFLFKLAGSPGWVVDTNTATGTNWWREPNGSGPFKVEQLKDDGSIVFSGWDGFWGGAPGLDEIVIRGGVDALQPLNQYEAGDIDITSVPFYAVDRVLSPSDRLHPDLVVVEQLSTTFITLNVGAAPYDDADLRRALLAAFDRRKVAEVMFDGKVRLAEGLVPPGILQRDWPAEYPAVDSRAAAAIAASGEIAQRPRLFEPGGGISSAFRQVLLRDAGLEVDAIDVEWPVFADLLTTGRLPACVLTWIADYPDPANFLTAMFRTGSPDNYMRYSNPEFDALVDDAEVEPDEARRAELYLAAQQLLIDDGVLLPLYHDVDYTLVKPWVHGLTITPIGILSLEDVWIAGSR
ncbi:MAG: hypothetical protein DCC58_00295 [Chloroflexi bacterium]|nr:MAG: hypothetical protein DCC58_00295 [Chloroflexota bacterium]